MGRAVGILSTAMAPMFVAAVAFAGDITGLDAERGTGTPPHGREPGSSAGTRAASPLSEYQMVGTVSDLDKDDGELTFTSTDGKKLELQLPRTAVQDLNDGQRVTLQIGIKPAPAGATSGVGSGTHGPGAVPLPGMRDDPMGGGSTGPGGGTAR